MADEELLNPSPDILESCDRNFCLNSRHFVNQLRVNGKHQQAIKILERLIFFRRRSAGQGDAQYMRSIYELAYIHREQHHYRAAQALLEPLLGLRLRLLGREHPATLGTMRLLASCYGRRGFLGAAEKMLNDALALQEQQLGPEHDNVCRTLNSLCLVYCKQGRLESARDAYLRSAAVLVDGVGLHDLDMLEALPIIARLCSDNGDDVQADITWDHYVIGSLSTFGGWASDHPRVLEALGEITQFYEERDRYEDARALWSRVYTIRKQDLSVTHALTLDSQACLSNVMYLLAAYQQASELAESEVEGLLKNLGHSSSIVTMSRVGKILETKLWFGICCTKNDQWKIAESVFTELISISKDLRKENPIYFLSLQIKGHFWMGCLRQAQDRLEDARDHLQKALRYRKNWPEATRGQIFKYMSSLANVLVTLGQTEEVESLAKEMKEAIESSEATDAISSRTPIEAISMLAHCYTRQQRFAEAKPLLDRVLSSWETELGPTHFFFLIALRCAAVCDAGLGKYSEAETSFEKAIHGFEIIHGFDGENTTDCMLQLLEVLHSQKKFDKLNALMSEWAAKGVKFVKLQGKEDEIDVESEPPNSLPNSPQSNFEPPST